MARDVGTPAAVSLPKTSPTEANVSLPPLWGKARMGERRAQARLCGRDARAPRAQTCPRKSIIPDFSPVIPAKAGIPITARAVMTARAD